MGHLPEHGPRFTRREFCGDTTALAVGATLPRLGTLPEGNSPQRKERSSHTSFSSDAQRLISELAKSIGPAIHLLSSYERKDLPGWNPILIRYGDTFDGICKFYGITDLKEIAQIATLNRIEDRNKIRAGGPLFLPRSKEELTNCFCQLVVDVDDGQFNNGQKVFSLPTISVSDYFNQKIYGEGVYHHGIYWPGVFFGHSVIDRRDSDKFPFDILMRKMTKIKENELPQKVRVTAARNLDMQGGSWLEARVVRMGYYGSPGEFVDSLLGNPYYNSQYLILATCVPESGKKDDRLYACAKIIPSKQ